MKVGDKVKLSAEAIKSVEAYGFTRFAPLIRGSIVKLGSSPQTAYVQWDEDEKPFLFRTAAFEKIEPVLRVGDIVKLNQETQEYCSRFGLSGAAAETRGMITDIDEPKNTVTVIWDSEQKVHWLYKHQVEKVND